MTFVLTEAYEGRPLRSYLKYTLSLSTATLARLKAREDGILVNGVRVTVRYVIRAGDRLELALEDTLDTATETVLPVDAPLDILYEDDRITVLNKPAGMPTHPSHGHLTDTLANALAFRSAAVGAAFVFRAIGRLDRNTSGIVLVAKTQAVAGFLGRALAEHRVIKRYIAVLEGSLPVDGQLHRIEVPICRPVAGVAMRTVCPGAIAGQDGCEYALTHYRVLASSPSHSLVLAMPYTGRTHQLRVHFAHLGHPLCGDEVYGTPPAPDAPIARQALHCLSLSFPLPFAAEADRHAKDPPFPDPSEAVNLPCAGGWMHTLAPLPPDMKALLNAKFPHIPSLADTDLLNLRAAELLRLDGPEA